MYLVTAAGSDDSEERACAQNFLLDERPSPDALDLYKPYFSSGPVSDSVDWYGRHGNFVREHLSIDPGESITPITFRPGNDHNRVTEIDVRLNLIRVEQLDSGALRGHDFEEVAPKIEAFQKDGDQASRDFLQGLCEAWNAERDRRPAYVTTEIQVKDILADGVDDWATRLRNRLGLGHLNPGPSGQPVAILVMRYSVAKAIDALDGQGHPAIPTVLDGDISNYFFPSPLPKPEATEAPLCGRTVNLTPVTSENDYEMGCELLNPRIRYHPEHFLRAGLITEPVTMPLDRARGFHLPWVRLALRGA